MTNRSTSKPFRSALDSAFFKSCSKNSADFSGQRPWVVPHCLAWKHTIQINIQLCTNRKGIKAINKCVRSVLKHAIFQWPSSIARNIITLALGKGISPVLKQKMTTNLRASADTTVVAAEWDTLLMLDNILQESDSPPQRHTLDGVGGFSRVLCKK